MNHIYTDKDLTNLFGRRGDGGTALFQPIEIGWCCPVDENHETTWSEFFQHIWCLDCEIDYFTWLCPKKYIPGHPHQSKSVVEEEIEEMRPLMAEWNLERYRALR